MRIHCHLLLRFGGRSSYLEDFGNRLEDERDRDREVLGKALSNIAAGISMISTAVMGTRIVFPGLEGDFTMAMKTPPRGASTTSMVSPTPDAIKSPSTNDPSTPRPAAAATTTQLLPAARALAALIYEEELTVMGRAAGAMVA